VTALRWFHSVYKPTGCFGQSVDEGVLPELSVVISYQIESVDPFAHHAESYEEYQDTPHRYYCESCLAACGDKKAVFHTGAAPLKNMKNGPTDKQRTQMSEHAEQHSIIWNWARSQEKKS
jgi:hypothetical protein